MSEPFVSIAEQIACVKRELGMRERVYGRWVEVGKMTQAKAERETREMRAVLATLERVEQEERLL